MKMSEMIQSNLNLKVFCRDVKCMGWYCRYLVHIILNAQCINMHVHYMVSMLRRKTEPQQIIGVVIAISQTVIFRDTIEMFFLLYHNTTMILGYIDTLVCCGYGTVGFLFDENRPRPSMPNAQWLYCSITSHTGTILLFFYNIFCLSPLLYQRRESRISVTGRYRAT